LKNRVYFIGMGGIGMSALSELAHSKGYTVGGSDLAYNERLKELKAKGIEVFVPQDALNIKKFSPAKVVISSAIKKGNPELDYAVEEGIPVWKRAEFLNELTRDKKQLAISGTHGKTTTSAFLGEALFNLGYDPMIFVGGIHLKFNSNIYCGKGKYFVLEADESDATLLKFSPYAAIITNIEEDHLDFYKGIKQIEETFLKFALQTEKVLVINGDNAGCVSLREKILQLNPSVKVVSYGINNKSLDYCAFDIHLEGKNGIRFSLHTPGGIENDLKLNLLGLHNLSNVVGVLSLLSELSLLKDKDWKKVISSFHGVKRRFEILGKYKGATLVDDYAHHPTEVDKVISMVESHYGKSFLKKKVRIIFQPHRYSRWKKFYQHFAEIFNSYHYRELILAPIYSAHEKEEEILSTEIVRDYLKETNKVFVFKSLNEIQEYLEKQQGCEGEIWLFLGAGDINTIPYNLRSKEEKNI
jgi:UDP-N-acetylmuramate--alanine ligase